MKEETFGGNFRRLIRSVWFWLALCAIACVGGALAWWSGTVRLPGEHILAVPLEIAEQQPSADHSSGSITAGPKRSLRLLIFGDTGVGTEPQFAVARALEDYCLKTNPDAIVLTGDNFYMDGVVSVADPQWREKFFSPYGTECLRTIPVYPTLGNHDYRGNVQAQIDASQVEPQWRLINRFYGVNFGDFLALTALDTNFVDWCGSSEYCLVDFWNKRVKDMKAMASKPWHIVVGHHPFSSSSAKYQGKHKRTLNMLLRAAVCQHADAYVSGHSHHLEKRQDPDCAAPFFISGGGGADLYGVIPDSAALFAQSKFGFLDLEAHEEFLTWRFIGVDGSVLYETKQARRSY